MDARARYFRQLKRLRRSARRWSVLAGTFAGATVVLVPYRGLGWPDAVWAALTGGTAALTYWRWTDLRQLAAQPAPEPQTRPLEGRIGALLARIPGGQGALEELRRVQVRNRLRGSSVVPAWERLDRAAQTLRGLAGRLGGPAESAVLEAAVAERTLRDVADRTAAVERAMRYAPGDPSLEQAHAELLGQLTEGVIAYEGLVAAAAGYVALDGRATVDTSSVSRLTEATDLLHGIAAGLTEMTTVQLPRLT